MSRPRKETHLMVRWDKREKDLRFFYPTSPPDGHLACAAFTRGIFGPAEPSFVDELKARGYDITTLRFSIEKLPKSPTPATTTKAGER